MKKLFKSFYIIIFLTLNLSCVEKKSTQKEMIKPEFVKTTKTDSLKFTSGIRAIFHDSKGNYWFGSHKEGISYYDGKSFQYFTTNEGLPGIQIRSIQEDKNGNIWMETANGVVRYDGTNITNYTPTLDVGSQNEWIKTDNDLWFGAGNNAGLYRYNGLTLNYLAFPKPKVSNPDNVYFVTGFSKGNHNMLWFATYAGIFGFKDHQFTIINDETLGLKNKTDKLHIRSVFEDSKGRLWIGNNGIGVLLKDKETIINFSEKNNLMHPTSSRSGDKSPPGTLEHVFVIQEDGDGNIWFGDRDTGAWKYDGKTVTNYVIDDKLTSSMIWSIYNDKNKHLLFGMEEGGVYEFNGQSFQKRF